MRAATIFLDLICLLLVEQLGDRRFTRRELAYDHLARLDSLAWPHLVRGSEHDDPEISARCRRLLAGSEEERTWELAGRILPPGCRQLPWLWIDTNRPWGDGWSSEDAGRWVDEARRRFPGDEPWRPACQLWVQSQIRQYRSFLEIRFDLAVMAAAEAEWHYHRTIGYCPLTLSRINLP